MRRFLTVSFILIALAVSAADATPAAHAQNNPCDDGTGTNICNTTTPQPVDPKAAGAAAKNPTEQGQAESTRWGLNYVMQMIAGLFAWLVGAAALTLNFSMYYTVVNMGGYITNLSAIKTVWEILRDIGNILLIFGFLAIGISIIINSDWYGGGQKLLPKLLIVAVFANFSLFAAEAMIDVGNLFATQIYKQINGGEIVAPMGATDAFFAVINKKGVAGVLMNRLGLASIYGQVLGKDKDGNNVVTGTGPWYMGFMSSIVFIVVAFVMFTLAFILIARFIVLILLIMVSPVGVVGLAVPGLQGWADKWWHTLFHQTITAPILLLMLYIALSVIIDKNFLGFGTTTPAWGGTQTGYIMEFAGTLLSYLIAMGLLLAVVYFAKTLSAAAAGWATKTAGKLSFGATAWGMRASGGWVSHRASERWKRSSLARVPVLGRSVSGVLDRGAKASFDIRGTGALKNLPGGSIEAGAAQKGGYKADLKARIEARTKYAGELKGRGLTDGEKAEQLALQNQIKGKQKAKTKETDPAAIRILDQNIKVLETKLEKIESVTDKGAQRKYATVLELGKDQKGRFNKYFNLAANTEAAKIIRAEAKKGKPDKDWTANMKKLLKEAGETMDTEAAPATPPITTPAGQSPATPATPGAGPTVAP